jgi:secondary thiamine-phosphate synthase enzyme
MELFSACSLLTGVTSTPAPSTRHPTRTATRISVHTTITGLTPKGSSPSDTLEVQPTVQVRERLAPHEPVSQYRHNRTGEDNGDAHIKRQVMGREVVVAVTNAKLDFGPWEQIFYGEFDGRRRKRVLIKIIGE